MLSLDTATQLKNAGLEWAPAEYDFFYIPFQGLDERVFVISDMSVIVELMGHEQAITFNGTAEWALDYLVLTDAVWVPTETQLRTILEQKLMERGEEQPVLALITTSDGYRCSIQYNGRLMNFDAFGVSETYAMALLYVLQHTDSH